MGYQDRDREIVDYQLYRLKNVNFDLRGPKPRSFEKDDFFVCVGAAQTFGCFCEKPYPTLLSERLGTQALNLGFGGAGPYFFLKQKDVINYINNAKFAIVQVMSGRSEDNAVFDSGGLSWGRRRADGTGVRDYVIYSELLKGYNDKQRIWPPVRYVKEICALLRRDYAKKIIAETRQNWVNNYKRLLKEIKVPKIVFWFSKRNTAYKENYKDVWHLFGEFPQLVNADMVNEIKRYSNEYVECISERGTPQLLISRFTGKPAEINHATLDKDIVWRDWKYNDYYPSPEMHIDAANVLESVCRQY